MIMSFIMLPILFDDSQLPPSLSVLLARRATTLAELAGLPPDQRRFFEFFLVRVKNPNTRRAYGRAVAEFFGWLGTNGVGRLADIQPLHVAAFIDEIAARCSIPTAKARLAAIRHLFDWLTAGHVVPVNPAHAVRGPSYAIERGKTPVLTAAETRQLLDSIDTDTLAGLRDRALIATMVFSFARIGAVTALAVDDVFTQDRRLHLRLLEKRNTHHVMPCHHMLEACLVAWLERAGLWSQPEAPIFQGLVRSRIDGQTVWRLSGRRLLQSNAFTMVRRRTLAAGIATPICNHTFRATGITAYLKNGGTLERAKAMAAHRSTRTTQLYDRRSDEATLDDIEKIQI